MEETYPIALALFDFTPVIFFLLGSIFLVRVSTWMSGIRFGRLAVVGSLLIFLGGFLKALWKLIFTIGLGDILWMSEIQFVLVAPGFLVLLIVVIRMARSENVVEFSQDQILPAIAVWKIPLLIVMTLASMGVMGILTFISFRRTARLAASGFIVAFLCLVAMGALASGEQTVARQWIEESINAVGQLGYMLGTVFLYLNIKRSQSS